VQGAEFDSGPRHYTTKGLFSRAVSQRFGGVLDGSEDEFNTRYPL